MKHKQDYPCKEWRCIITVKNHLDIAYVNTVWNVIPYTKLLPYMKYIALSTWQLGQNKRTSQYQYIPTPPLAIYIKLSITCGYDIKQGLFILQKLFLQDQTSSLKMICNVTAKQWFSESRTRLYILTWQSLIFGLTLVLNMLAISNSAEKATDI